MAVEAGIIKIRMLDTLGRDQVTAIIGGDKGKPKKCENALEGYKTSAMYTI